MINKLFYTTSIYLSGLPETGMGYQLIEARQQFDYQRHKFVVYNSELIVELDNQFQSFRSRIINEGYNTLLNKATTIDIKDIKLLDSTNIREERALTENKRIYKGRYSGGKAAIENPKKPTSGSDDFVRISAYENDKRIDFENKCLKPGSFTTTLDDYVKCVTFEDDPIDRYALPNDEPIKWAFFIRPQKGELFQEGIVQPAFGHEGGGIEDYFENGTSQNTYLIKKEYGKLEI